MGSSLSNSITSSPTALALLTLTSALALTLAFQTNNNNKKNNSKIMSTKEKAIALAGEPKLPPNFLTDSFTNSRSQSIFTIHLPRKDTSTPPNAMIFLAHGIAEHCCRPGYLRMYQSLAAEGGGGGGGIDVYALDHHGHGRSDGEPRGYAEKFDHFVNDFVQFIELTKQNMYISKGEPCPPLIIMGQSMGALIAVMACLQLKNDVAGMILTGPAMGIDMSLEIKIQKFFGPIIDALIPKAKIVDAVDPKDLSRNTEAVQAYIDDPLCPGGKIVARTAIGMDKAFDVVKERRGEVTCPILIVHGTEDKTTSSKASLEFFANVGTPLEKKKYVRAPGLYHEIFEEPETDKLMEFILAFAKSGGKEFAEVEGDEKDGVVEVEFK